ncbi:hypothetical protein FMUND_2316 [Fusarium mundagurra]|uniref:Uncharacterized protein n=1 Tax=Fusarium mundagurra TaxID=1567541 RepID=A0A8H5Z2X4_9HYPO|nr:hypothetical protein FMUND_2316 [Fusarium mundagurra]
MNVTPTLKTLPSEVMILIMRSISSPIDLQSAINASPVIFQHYLAHRSFIMAPTIHRIKTSYSAMEFGNHLTQITRTLPYRLLGRPMVAREADGVLVYVMSLHDRPCYTNWETHLPLICELYRQRGEADHLMTEYSMEAWNGSLLYAQELRLELDPASEWHPDFDRPLVLSERETYGLERGFLLYESWRLDMYSGGWNDSNGLSAFKDYASWRILARPWASFGTGIRVPLRDSRYLKSILAFVFDKFRSFVHLVSQQCWKDPSKPPTMSCSENNQASEFLHRTEDQDLRFILSLCLRGYAVLQNLRQMTKEELPSYVLSSYLEFANHDAWLCSSPESEEKGRVDRRLSSRLKIRFGDLGDLRDPLTRGYYFWDESRKSAIFGLGSWYTA